MRTRKRTEITFETERLIVMSKSRVSVVSWCRECRRRTKMITVDEAATIAAVSSRTIYRWAEARKLHFVETSEGRLLICSESTSAAESSGLLRLSAD